MIKKIVGKKAMSDEEPQMRFDHVAVRLLHYILIFGGKWFNSEELSLRDIWMLNIYTDQWRKYIVPSKKSVPPPTISASATMVRSDIYMFGGMHTQARMLTNELWKLTRTPEGCFSWNQIEFQTKAKTPSPRAEHSEWEHAEKLWIFGGFGYFRDGYLHDHGDFEGDDYNDNNQLLCFNPLSQDWTNPQCFGSIPPPASGHAAARTGDSIWLFGGSDDELNIYHDLYQLDMSSLTWTLIETGQMKPDNHYYYTLTAASDKYLVMHARDCSVDISNENWIFDVNAMSWKTYNVEYDVKQLERWEDHTGTRGINSMVIILGGKKPVMNIFIMLESKTLQHLALQRIHRAKDELPLQKLPKKLISLLDSS